MGTIGGQRRRGPGVPVVAHRMDDDDRAGCAHHGHDRADDGLEQAELDRGPRSGARACARDGGTTAQRGPHDRVLEGERRRDGHQNGQSAASLPAELVAVLAAALAIVQVATQGAAAQRRAAHGAQLQADLVAVGLAG